jgi:hypothetical protein
MRRGGKKRTAANIDVEISEKILVADEHEDEGREGMGAGCSG